ncbi:RNA binding [Hirschfeldia incana]|nr:RNA binding [Hirschfeldia incana]KAJ0242461.1 RNA binding [Hirschfeldia incana]
MGSGGDDDDRTFNGDFSEEGVVKLKERVKVKLKEYMGDYTDDILVEYVIVLLKNGRRKEEAKNELKIFLADDSDSFVSWLWDHLGESVDEYFTSTLNEDKALVQMESESEKGRAPARRSRQWRTQTSDVPPLLSSEVHKVHNYEKDDHRERRGKRSPSPETRSHRKRSKTDSSRNEQREAKPVVSSRLLQFAMRDALGTSKPTESSLKRLRSVVSASTQDSSEPEPARKTRSVARVVNPTATVLKAVAEAAEDAKNPKSGRSVFDRISQPAGVSETSDQHMILGEVPPKSDERSEDHEPVQHQYSQRLDNNGVYVENMTVFDTSLQSNFASDRSRLGSSVNGSHSSSLIRNRVNNPKSLQHRLVDNPNRVQGTNYQNHLTEGGTKQTGFSGNAGTGKTVKLEEQMKVPDVVGLRRYMDGGRLVSSEAITESSTEKILGSGNTKSAIAKEDSLTKKSVPGTLSTTRPLEDARSRTIFVANVHFGATKDSLSRHFNKFGEVLKAVIVTDPATGQPSGSAYIEFTRKESAESALSLDGTSFMSRILKIVKGSNEQQQEAATSSMSWSRAGRYTRASTPYRRGIPGGAFRGRSVVRGGARSMQWKRDSAETGPNNVNAAPSTRSMTYVRTESQSNGNATA